MVFGKNKKALKIVEAEADEEVEEEVQEEPEVPAATKAKPTKEPKKELTVEEVLINHEQRLAQVEASLYRLRGI